MSVIRKIGQCYERKRVLQAGLQNKSEKWTLLLKISGDDAADQWKDMWIEGGTIGIGMIHFILHILDDIGPGTQQCCHCFIIDKLNSHHNIVMTGLSFEAGH